MLMRILLTHAIHGRSKTVKSERRLVVMSTDVNVNAPSSTETRVVNHQLSNLARIEMIGYRSTQYFYL
jgi:hypothetical protein